MSIMRSEIKSGGMDWLGVKTGKLSKITDLASKYDWADVYLNCEFEVEGSQYPRVLKIAGSFDKNPNGTIKDCTLLRKLTYFLDAVGENGGVNQNGEWVDEKEETINDIANYLETQYAGTDMTIYVFRELAKDGKAYTRIHNKVLAKSNTSETKLQDYIDFLKSKNFIKEAPADHRNDTPNNVASSMPEGMPDVGTL